MEQILSFKSKPQFGRANPMSPAKPNRKSLKLFPFVTLREKHGDVPIHLKVNEYTFKGRNSVIFSFYFSFIRKVQLNCCFKTQ